MDIARPEEVDVPFDPLEVVEHVLTAENLPFDRTDDGLVLIELVEGVTLEQITAATDAPFTVAEGLV